MANFTPTPQQARAISDQDVDILVSASSGSGKTAVLVDRVIELLKTDPTLNIDRFSWSPYQGSRQEYAGPDSSAVAK